MDEDRVYGRACPAIILAKSRIDKLNVLRLYDIISITRISGSSNIGTPFGINSRYTYNLLLYIVRNKKARLNVSAIENVMIICPVNVKPNGTRPYELEVSEKMDKYAIIGKYTIPFIPSCCLIVVIIK